MRRFLILLPVLLTTTALTADTLPEVYTQAESAIKEKYGEKEWSSSRESEILKKIMEDHTLSAQQRIDEIKTNFKWVFDKLSLREETEILPVLSDSSVFLPPLQWKLHSLALTCRKEGSTSVTAAVSSRAKTAVSRSKSAKTWDPNHYLKLRPEIKLGAQEPQKESEKLPPYWDKRLQKILADSFDAREQFVRESPDESIRLIFSVEFINNTNIVYSFSGNDAFVPLYIGSIHIADAMPAKNTEKIYIGQNVNNIRFEADIAKDKALVLMDRLRTDIPSIHPEEGILLAMSDNSTTDILQKSVPKNVAPLSIEGLQDIFLTHFDKDNKLVSIHDAMQAANRLFEANARPFEFDEDGNCIRVCGIDLNEHGDALAAVTLGPYGTFISKPIPESILSNPYPESGISVSGINVFNEEEYKDGDPLLLQAALTRLKVLAERPAVTDIEEAQKTCAESMLADCYYKGSGVKKDYEEAVKWYLKLAEADDAKAQSQLGICYYNGFGVEKNYEESAAWFFIAAEQGDVYAMWRLGQCYYSGEGTPQDYTEAVKWLRKASEAGQRDAQRMLGYCYLEGKGIAKNIDEAVRWYRESAEQGLASAQCALAARYAKGEGVEQNYEEAVKWVRKAAEQGYRVAERDLGYCYYAGQGVPQDYAEAVKWYRKSADQGYMAAQRSLGARYAKGEGVQQDYKEAVKWFLLAAEQNDSDSQAWLGTCYYDGKGVKKDFVEAVNWYGKAAEQGNAIAQYMLGVCYYLGQGLPKDYEDAAYWYRKAAEQGDPDAQYDFGYCCYNGIGTNQDYGEAVNWFTKAAEQNNASAQYMLGTCFYEGQGVDKNKARALEWYSKASAQGMKAAQNLLRIIGTSR